MARKSKISRNTMFYSETDFNFETEIGENYISQDMNQTVLVFQIDRTKTTVVDLYGESVDEDSIVYKDPVEINVTYTLEEGENKSYDKAQNLGSFVQVGNFNFGVYEKTLKKNKIDIKKGDYIGLQVTEDQMEYFVVVNDGRVNFDNKHTMNGYKPFYRTVRCVIADKNEFKGI